MHRTSNCLQMFGTLTFFVASLNLLSCVTTVAPVVLAFALGMLARLFEGDVTQANHWLKAEGRSLYAWFG